MGQGRRRWAHERGENQSWAGQEGRDCKEFLSLKVEDEGLGVLKEDSDTLGTFPSCR